MPIRNPFTRRPGLTVTTDENARPASAAGKDVAHPGFERVDTVGSKASSALSVRSAHSPDNGEYKMSGTSPLPRPQMLFWVDGQLTTCKSGQRQRSVSPAVPGREGCHLPPPLPLLAQFDRHEERRCRRRDRALPHLARIVRFVPQVICTFSQLSHDIKKKKIGPRN